MIKRDDLVQFVNCGVLEGGTVIQIIKDSALVMLSETKMCLKPISKLVKKEMVN
jgi:hypothetical protein